MNATDKFIAARAHVDEAAIQPLPNSKKVYVTGSRPDIRVPMREISQTPTAGEANPPFYVYDCSGPYTDPRSGSTSAKGCRPCVPAGSPSGATPKNCPA